MVNRVFEPSVGSVPITLSVEVGGAVLGLRRQGAYAAAWRKELPTINFGRRRYVLVSRLEEIAGRSITAADIARAEETVRARKQARAIP
jgi:hypothetical protein